MNDEVRKPPIGRPIGPTLDGPGLNALFDRYNQEYLESCLPKFRVVLRKVKNMKSGGRCSSKRRLIRISRDSGLDYRSVLLHEMIHAKDIEWHGIQFHIEVERLMAAGAPIIPSLFVRPRWLAKLPLCRAWAEEKGLPKLAEINPADRCRHCNSYLEFEDAVIIDGARTFDEAIEHAFKRNGEWEIMQLVQGGSVRTFYSHDEIRAARSGFRSALKYLASRDRHPYNGELGRTGID